MAVPKKRTGASAQGHRRANWKATKPATTTCPKCGAIALTHTICTECGYYKGKPASIKHEDYNAAIEEAKPAKKKAAAKKSTKKEKAVEEKVEEIKEEVKVEAEEAKADTEDKEKDAE